jgi:hypothetical protein
MLFAGAAEDDEDEDALETIGGLGLYVAASKVVKMQGS